MRIVPFLIAAIAIVSVSARRGAPPPAESAASRPHRGRISNVIGSAHFGWGLDELHDDPIKEEVKEGKRG